MDFTFVPFEDNHRQVWDAFVRANPHAWPGQDAAIIDFERGRGHASFAHLAFGDDRRLIAVAPMFLLGQRQARVFNFRILSTGSSLRGGPLLRPGLSLRVRQQFMKAWAAWLDDLASRERIDIIRVAFPHMVGDQLSTDFYDGYPLSEHGFADQGRLTLLMDLTVPGQLFDRLPPKTRRMVRCAETAGVEFRPVEDREEWLRFHEINVETFAGRDFEPYSLESMALVWDRFVDRGLAHAFCVGHEGRTISVTMIVGTRYSCYGWLGFNRRPMPIAGAKNLLTYRVMEWLRHRGVHYFEIGSMEFDDPLQRRIGRFKQSFGGRPHYGLQGLRTRSALKQASADWLRALSRKLNSRKPRSSQMRTDEDADACGAGSQL